MRAVGILLVVGSILFSVSAWSATVEQARVWRSPDSTRLVFDLSDSVSHKIFQLNNPERLVIDIKNGKKGRKLNSSLKTLSLANTPVREVRSGVRNKTDLRVVLDLKSGIRPRSFVLKPNAQYGDRLVIDLFDKQQPSKPVPIPATRGGDIIIAIDPGHGGEDPGATGVGGIHEKHVVLNISRYLADMLRAEPGFKPVMTRDGDYYVSLRGRTQVARKHNADMFVSIHADAFTNKRARGSSVFALSHRGATSETARWLAQKENSSDLIGGVGAVSLDDKDEMLAGVLLDLSMTATLSASLKVGDDVLKSVGGLNKLHKSRVEQAAFVVLKSPDIPSILVETGFITNPQDGQKLAQRSYQKKMARAIFYGILRYFKSHPPPGTSLAKKGQAGATRYTVRAGDTLSGIAVKHRVSLTNLRRANRLTHDRIKVGQVLKIP